MNNEEYFKKELTKLINVSNIDALCNIPDFVLSKYLFDCLTAYITLCNENKKLNDSKTLNVDNKKVDAPPQEIPEQPKKGGGYITELYNKSGGIPTKQRYSEEIKQREN